MCALNSDIDNAIHSPSDNCPDSEIDRLKKKWRKLAYALERYRTKRIKQGKGTSTDYFGYLV